MQVKRLLTRKFKVVGWPGDGLHAETCYLASQKIDRNLLLELGRLASKRKRQERSPTRSCRFELSGSYSLCHSQLEEEFVVLIEAEGAGALWAVRNLWKEAAKRSTPHPTSPRQEEAPWADLVA